MTSILLLTIVSKSFPNHDNLTSIPEIRATITRYITYMFYCVLLGQRSGLRAVRIKETHLLDRASPDVGGEPGTLVT